MTYFEKDLKQTIFGGKYLIMNQVPGKADVYDCVNLEN